MSRSLKFRDVGPIRFRDYRHDRFTRNVAPQDEYIRFVKLSPSDELPPDGVASVDISDEKNSGEGTQEAFLKTYSTCEKKSVLHGNSMVTRLPAESRKIP